MEVVSFGFLENRQIGHSDGVLVENFECWQSDASEEWLKGHLNNQDFENSHVVWLWLRSATGSIRRHASDDRCGVCSCTNDCATNDCATDDCATDDCATDDCATDDCATDDHNNNHASSADTSANSVSAFGSNRYWRFAERWNHKGGCIGCHWFCSSELKCSGVCQWNYFWVRLHCRWIGGFLVFIGNSD
jgi:hypothetical protein